MSQRVAARFSQPAVKAAWFPFWMQLPAAVAAAAGLVFLCGNKSNCNYASWQLFQQDQLCKKTGLSNTARKARKLQSKWLH